GDTVNVASRLEAKCKELRWPIVASSATLEAAGPGFVIAETREIDLVGREASISVSHVIGAAGDDEAPKPDMDMTLPAGAGAVLVENARATAEATKAECPRCFLRTTKCTGARRC